MQKSISLSELQEIQRSKEPPALFKVLAADEFKKGSIPGSKNAPIDRSDFIENVGRQTGGDLNRHVVVYCAGPQCGASARAVKTLTDFGYTHVTEFRGGMEEWNASSSGGRGQKDTGINAKNRSAS
jgi:rhodanese-related sulfurtransferase